MKKIQIILAFLVMLNCTVLVSAAEPMSVNIVIEDALEAEKNSTPITVPSTDSKSVESIVTTPALPESPPISDVKPVVVEEMKAVPKIEAEVSKPINKPTVIPVQIPRPSPAKIKGVSTSEESVVEIVSVDNSKDSTTAVSDKPIETKQKIEEKQQVNVLIGRPSPAVIKIK